MSETEDFSVDESWLIRPPVESGMPTQALSRRLQSDEKALIEAALAEARGQVSGPTGAAIRLGLPASTLESKIRALCIDKYVFKNPLNAARAFVH